MVVMHPAILTPPLPICLTLIFQHKITPTFIAILYIQHQPSTLFQLSSVPPLKIQNQPSGVFNASLDPPQEQHGFSAIDEAVVVCECQVHHWACQDLFSHHHWALHNGVHPQYRRLQHAAGHGAGHG